MNIQKVENFRSFYGVSNENLIVTPGKNEPSHVVHNIKKYFGKMNLVFPQILKNCQNHGLFEGAVMGRPKKSDQIILIMIERQSLPNL